MKLPKVGDFSGIYQRADGTIALAGQSCIRRETGWHATILAVDTTTGIIYFEKTTTPYYDQNGKMCRMDLDSKKIIPLT